MNANPHRLRSQYRFRVVWSALLALALLASALAPSASVQAQQPIDPVKHVFFSLDHVVIHNNLDQDAGEIRMTVRVWRINDGCPSDATSFDCITDLMRSSKIDFRANDGETVNLGISFPDTPGATDYRGPDVGPSFGIPLYPGRRYGWEISAVERDFIWSRSLGRVSGIMHAENDWGLGVHDDHADTGHFSAHYAIQPIKWAPNLKPVALDAEGTSSVCVSVANDGTTSAGPFGVTVLVDGSAGPNATVESDGADAGTTARVCTGPFEVVDAQHRWSVVVDDQRKIVELDEYDNRLDREGLGAGPASPVPSPMPMPSPKPNASLPDLTITAIEINGRVPDGKDDCKDGKNTVAVTVKNVGAADAGSFVVHLSEDKADVALGDKKVDGLKAGQDRELRFDGVRLKKGTQTLEAFVDSKESVAELNEANNRLSVASSCKDDD